MKKKIDCDFLVFSGHKMFASTGVGVLYGKYELLDQMDPFLYGGQMINKVDEQNSTWNKLPLKFNCLQFYILTMHKSILTSFFLNIYYILSLLTQ